MKLIFCCFVLFFVVTVSASVSISKRKVPDVKWDTTTDMDEERKNQVLFAIFTAEVKGFEGGAKNVHIRDELRRVYGGQWVVSRIKNPGEGGNVQFNAEPGFLVAFSYEGYFWQIGKVAGGCT